MSGTPPPATAAKPRPAPGPGRGEDELIGWLRRRPGVSGIGDDAAFLGARGPLAITMDQQIEGVHFRGDLDPGVLGQRLLEVNLSDLAACGAQPDWALCAVAAPSTFEHRRFFRGLLAAATRRGVRLIGGDLASSPAVRLALTLAGSRPRRGKWLRRSGARAGDALWVGGTLGDSAVGCRLVRAGGGIRRGRVELPPELAAEPRLRRAAGRSLRRHLLPRAQIELGHWLGRQRSAAAIDVSDGLAIDLRRLATASDVGVEVHAAALPLSSDLRVLAEWLGEDPFELALGGGEDYVLLFALPGSVAPPARFGCHRIGQVTRGRRILLRTANRLRPLPRLGYDHLR